MEIKYLNSNGSSMMISGLSWIAPRLLILPGVMLAPAHSGIILCGVFSSMTLHGVVMVVVMDTGESVFIDIKSHIADIMIRQ